MPCYRVSPLRTRSWHAPRRTNSSRLVKFKGEARFDCEDSHAIHRRYLYRKSEWATAIPSPDQWASSSGGDIPLTLNLTRATAETAWKIPEPPPPPRMMPADVDPAFEVASIKPTNPGGRGGGIRMQGRQFTATNLSVSNLILIAYGIHPRQLIGAPDWIEKDRYDILGKPDMEGQPNNRHMRALFQKLLADRFSIKFHHEKREFSVYTIVVAKNGAKLTASEEDPKRDPTMFFYGPGKFVAKNATIADLRVCCSKVSSTGRWSTRQVSLADTTSGWYTGPISLCSVAAVEMPPTPSDQDALQDIYGAVQQQLGLRLEATKTQTDVMVVDQLERPSEN